MEKRTPHCKLALVHQFVRAGQVRTTFTALAGAAALGLDSGAMFNVILGLAPSDFYKSMTTHDDHRIWQDVYRACTAAGRVYLKLTVIDDLLIVSFKELQA